MEDIFLDIKNINTSYKNFKISNINFQLRQGEIMGLVGRSGSGKSTIIKTLLGLKTPDSGTVSFFINNQESELRQEISYSAQGNSIFPLLTIEENLELFGKLNKLKKEDIKKRAENLLKKLDLYKHKNKRIIDLSGGMKKRADIAVTLLTKPKIIVLDEPFAGLDITMKNFIWYLIKEFASEGVSFIISSHLLGDLEKNCSKFGLVHDQQFYSHEQIVRGIKNSGFKSLETYLEKLFVRS
jgi:ABC-2 type transport system ATP-binding protein